MQTLFQKTQYLLLLWQSHLVRAKSRKVESRVYGGGAAEKVAAIDPTNLDPHGWQWLNKYAHGDLLSDIRLLKNGQSKQFFPEV